MNVIFTITPYEIHWRTVQQIGAFWQARKNFTNKKNHTFVFHSHHNSSSDFVSENVCLPSNIQGLREMINVRRKKKNSFWQFRSAKGMDDTMVETDMTISLISCQLVEIVCILCCLRWSENSKRNPLSLAKCTQCLIVHSFHFCTMNSPKLLSSKRILIKARRLLWILNHSKKWMSLKNSAFWKHFFIQLVWIEKKNPPDCFMESNCVLLLWPSYSR